MNRKEIEDIVLSVLGKVIKCEVNLDSSRENTMAWNSLKHIDLVFLIEDKLNVRFSQEELEKLNSVNAIVDIVSGHHAS
jgi:acyl carrier protein